MLSLWSLVARLLGSSRLRCQVGFWRQHSRLSIALLISTGLLVAYWKRRTVGRLVAASVWWVFIGLFFGIAIWI